MMKTKFYFAAIAVIIALYFVSCSDFISVNLKKKSVIVLAPGNGATSTDYTITFWWEELKGAENYELQIVQPDFGNIQKLFLDTIITTNKFSFTLIPGDYQWRVRAKNSTSHTDYVNYWFTIDSTSDLSNQTLLLLSPSDNVYKNSFTHVFSWSSLSNATNYVFQLYTPTGIAIGYPQTTTTNNITKTFDTEGVFKWRVFAQNGVSSSPYAERTIAIDTTKPAVPVLVSPKKDTTSLNPIPLMWNISTAADSSHIIISTDSTFAIISEKDTMMANTSNPLTYNLKSTIIGVKYWWKVQSKDKAGNVSSYFAPKSIKRN